MMEELGDSTWTRREQARERQIVIGKARPEYRRYAQEVSRERRDASHPSTPGLRARISKRQFDRTLSAWRCRLHEYDVPRVATDGSRGEPDITPLARRTSHTCDDLSSEFSETRTFPSSGKDRGVVPLRLADALLAAVSAPVTPQVGTGHHHLQPSAQQLLTGACQPHLQLRPQQLDFGVGPKQAWTPCSPMDGTPSTMCTLSPITPAPQMRPALLGGRQPTVFENDYQPSQQCFNIFSQQQIFGEPPPGDYRNQSPVVTRQRGSDTPPRTPPRRLDIGDAAEEPIQSGSGTASDAGSGQPSSPPSVAKTPSYVTGMVADTPSPRRLYGYRSGAYAPSFAAENTAQGCLDNNHMLADITNMLPQQPQPLQTQQPQFPMHPHLHMVPWAMY